LALLGGSGVVVMEKIGCSPGGLSGLIGSGLPSLAPAKRGGWWHGLCASVWGLACSLLIVNQVLVRLWARRTSRVVLASLTVWGFGSGLFGGPWPCRHGCLTRFASLFDDESDCWLGCSVQGRLCVC